MLTQYRDIMAIDGAWKVRALSKHAYSDEFRAFVDSVAAGEYEI